MLLKFKSITITFLFGAGIVIAHYACPSVALISILLGCLAMVIAVIWKAKRGQAHKTLFFGVIAYIIIIGIGVLNYTIHKDTNQRHHYTHIIDNETDIECILRISDRLKPNTYHHNYVAEIIQVKAKQASGKLLLHIAKDSVFDGYLIDDILFTKIKILPIQKPLNPHQFDYAAYLQLKNIHHQAYINTPETRRISSTVSSIYGYADRFRLHVKSKLSQVGFSKASLSIINAVLLGQRQDISPKLYNNYVDSGTIHILAVSGLHVGLLLLILNHLLKPLLYFRYGHYVRPLLIIILLWSFAIIAGLSPSVTRAVTMFSLISIAMHLKRSSNIYNTLAISAFFILLFKPQFLFEVGFQMSYLAVLGIVSMQPLLERLIQSRYFILKKLWQIFTVTIAAQLGVLPISLYYFHQFPGLFFISNIVIIPFLGVILILGFSIIILSLFDSLPKLLCEFYNLILCSLNDFVSWIAHFEVFILKDIPFSLVQVGICYFIILSSIYYIKKKQYIWLLASCFGIVGFISHGIVQKSTNNSDAFIIFNQSKHSILAMQSGTFLSVYHTLDSEEIVSNKMLKNFTTGERIRNVDYEPISTLYLFKEHNVLIVDSLGLYQNLSFKPNVVLLRNSPKVNLIRLIDSLRPQAIIADASNYTSYIERWKTTAKEKGTYFHYTKENGAFILK